MSEDCAWRLLFFLFLLFSFVIGDDSDDGGPKLENFLANKFNIVKKKSVRINEYRFLANKFGILAKKGSNILLRLVVDFSYH